MQSGKATNKVSMGERGDGWSKIANVSVLIFFLKVFLQICKAFTVRAPL
jgi:hypothetical protein